MHCLPIYNSSKDLSSTGGSNLQRNSNISKSDTNISHRDIPSSLIPMTEEDKKRLEQVLFNHQLASVGLDFLNIY